MQEQETQVILTSCSRTKKLIRFSITVGVIALVLALNILLSVLCRTMYWYVDMTTNEITQIGDSIPLIEQAVTDYTDRSGNDVEFRAVFCQPRDRLMESEVGMYIVRCVEEFEDQLPNFTVRYYDVQTNPSLVESYRATAISAITAQNIIFEACKKGTDERIAFRMFSQASFFISDQTTGAAYAFKGERCVSTALLGLIGERPIAAMITGHGEAVTSEVGKDGLAALCEESGFATVAVDLTTAEIPADTRVVIINGPTADYGATELRKVEKYVNNGGNLILFMDPIKQDLYNLEQLALQYGVSFYKDAYVQDASIAQDGDAFHLSAVYDTTVRKDEANESYVDAPGAQLTAELRAMSSQPKAIFKNACAMQKLTVGDTSQYPSGRNHRDVSLVFTTSNAASITDGKQQMYPLMSWSLEETIHNDSFNNTTTYSYQLISGCTAYTAYEYLQSNAYANNDVIQQALNNMRVRVETSEIDFRVLDKEALSIAEDNTAAKTAWTVIAIVVVAGVTVLGTIVYVRRKHR